MAGIIDKIKGMFGGKPKTGSAADSGASSIDTLKKQAGEIKDQADDMVDKVGDKVPDQVKDVYDKVSDKVEDIIPGDSSNDGGTPAN